MTRPKIHRDRKVVCLGDAPPPKTAYPCAECDKPTSGLGEFLVVDAAGNVWHSACAGRALAHWAEEGLVLPWTLDGETPVNGDLLPAAPAIPLKQLPPAPPPPPAARPRPVQPPTRPKRGRAATSIERRKP